MNFGVRLTRNAEADLERLFDFVLERELGRAGGDLELAEEALAAIRAGVATLNLDSAVARGVDWRKASNGTAFKPIQGAAPQFQIGNLAPPGMLNCDSVLANFHVVNCGK